jgi:hypothetical protein
MLVCFITIWNIYNVVLFVVIWYIFPVWVCRDQEKSGNPDW